MDKGVLLYGTTHKYFPCNRCGYIIGVIENKEELRFAICSDSECIDPILEQNFLTGMELYEINNEELIGGNHVDTFSYAWCDNCSKSLGLITDGQTGHTYHVSCANDMKQRSQLNTLKKENEKLKRTVEKLQEQIKKLQQS